MEAENLPDTTAMPEGAEYRREQRLEHERGWAGGGGDCCLVERSGGVLAPAWGGRGPKWRREEGREVRESGERESMEENMRKEAEKCNKK